MLCHGWIVIIALRVYSKEGVSLFKQSEILDIVSCLCIERIYSKGEKVKNLELVSVPPIGADAQASSLLFHHRRVAYPPSVAQD